MRPPVQLIAAGALLLAAGAGCTDPAAPDRDATEAMFLETCAPGGELEEVTVCRCAFERITEELSADELEDLDRRVRGEPETVPAEIVEAALDCAAEPLTPTTLKPPDDDTTTSTTAAEPEDE